MIVSAFHSRNDDWVLPHKLRALSQFCDRIQVILDRSPQSEAICRRFPKVEVRHWEPTHEIPERDDGGSIQCEEGLMRQAAWDWCASHEPEWVILGDSDEVPTPDTLGFLQTNPQPQVDVFYVDCVNLYGGAFHCITGPCIYSWQRQDNNKRSMICRWRRGREYKYDVGKFKHVMLDPNPVHPSRWEEDATHRRVLSPKLVHYKWAHWPKWMNCPQRLSFKYQNYLKNVEVSPTPRPWLWRWDADELLRDMAEPIAVVGNGPVEFQGRKIDGAGSVIRFNNFQTDGFEARVGKRTDLWVTNVWHDVIPREWPGEVMCVMHEGHHDEEVGRWLGMYPHMRTPGNSNWIDAAADELKVRRPSTGLTTLHHLVKLGKRIEAYGFSGMVGGHYDNPFHECGHTDERAALDRLRRMGVRFN